MQGIKDTENTFKIRSTVAGNSSVSQRMCYDGSGNDACPKLWGSSTFWVKDIVKEQRHQSPSPLVDDLNTVTLEKDLEKGLPSKRSLKKRGSPFAQEQLVKSNEVTTSLKKIPIKTTNQSILSSVETEERRRHHEESVPQYRQLFKEAVLQKLTDERTKDKIGKLYRDNDNTVISSFEDGTERRLQHFGANGQEHRLFQRQMTAKEEEEEKYEEKLALDTKTQVVTYGQGTEKYVPLQQQYVNYSEQESWRVPIIVKEEAGTSQNFEEFYVQQQKQEKDFSFSRKAMYQNSGLTNLDTETQSPLLDSPCSTGSDTLDDISTHDGKTLVKLDSQEAKDDLNEGLKSPHPRKVKNRSSFSVEQIYTLERTFERQKYLGTKERELLARRLGLSDMQVKTWFQNRRMKMKRKRAEQKTDKRTQLDYLSTVASSVHPSSACYHGYHLEHIPAVSMGTIRPCLRPSPPLGVLFNDLRPSLTTPPLGGPRYGYPWVYPADSTGLYAAPNYGRISPPLYTQRVSPPLYPGTHFPFTSSTISPFTKNTSSSFTNKM